MSYTLEEYPTISLIADTLYTLKYEPSAEAIYDQIGLGLSSGYNLQGIQVFVEPLAAAIILLCDNEYPEETLEHMVSICEAAELNNPKVEMSKVIDDMYTYGDDNSTDNFMRLIMHLFNYVFLIDTKT